MKFDCDCCGACCRNIRFANFNHELDRGDGVCKNLDTTTNLCTIYATRPIFCNVDAYYEKFLAQTMSREDFHKLNHAACERLKQRDGNVTLHPMCAPQSLSCQKLSPRSSNLTAQVNRAIVDA